MTPLHPPIAGMTVELWSWLRESGAVRPHVIARVRAALAAGQRVTAEEVALAMLAPLAWEGGHKPFRDVARAS